MRVLRSLLFLFLVLSGVAVVGASPAQAAKRFREFPVPTPNSYPIGITAGPDGNLWFTEFFASEIGRVTTGGAITEFPVPTPNSGPNDISAGPDGNVWFTEG